MIYSFQALWCFRMDENALKWCLELLRGLGFEDVSEAFITCQESSTGFKVTIFSVIEFRISFGWGFRANILMKYKGFVKLLGEFPLYGYFPQYLSNRPKIRLIWGHFCNLRSIPHRMSTISASYNQYWLSYSSLKFDNIGRKTVNFFSV